MPRKTHNELTAGLFVIFGLAALLAVVIWLGAAELFRPARGQAFFFARESAGSLGLLPGNEVKINDDVVGKIEHVRPDPANRRTLYVVQLLREDLKIHSDARARVAAGLVGASALVVVNRGSHAQPPADADHPVEIAGGLDEAMADISAAARKLRQVIDAELDPAADGSAMKNAKSILTDLNAAAGKVLAILETVGGEVDPNRSASLVAKVHRGVDDVTGVAASLRDQTDPNAPGSLLAKVHTGLDGVNTMLADAQPKVTRTLDAVAETAERIRGYTNKDVADLLAQLRSAGTEIVKIAADLGEVSGKVKGLVNRNETNLDETLDNLMLVSDHLKATATDLRRKPWLLLYRPDQKEVDSENIKSAARAFQDGATQLDQAITKLRAMDPKTLEAAELKAVRDHLHKTFENFTKAEEALFKELSK